MAEIPGDWQFEFPDTILSWHKERGEFFVHTSGGQYHVGVKGDGWLAVELVQRWEERRVEHPSGNRVLTLDMIPDELRELVVHG